MHTLYSNRGRRHETRDIRSIEQTKGICMSPRNPIYLTREFTNITSRVLSEELLAMDKHG
ncbi:hypothetical protein H5410_015888 [Solanum commersonii]|uniref:Uncharacterized protein n=1 Tax=Solanum commersonii TaxID=4109 RepID=A0A9J5ZV32_SOLCO|nr:hypothetical protein H5410_015888 [Solanum commersonii]